MSEPKRQSVQVTITDIEIPFGTLVMFFIEIAFAALPAILLLFVAFFSLGALVGAIAPDSALGQLIRGLR